ncbi:MAG TPA: hypothetical protein VNU71_08175 [Burkholderiaceae bacterium]|nr:hypothetical protein [Burkholderiaceae bacterium]
MRTTPSTQSLSHAAAEPVANDARRPDARRPDAGPTELTPDEIANVAGGFGPAGNWSATTTVEGPAGNWS